jgi:hypothetical protein
MTRKNIKIINEIVITNNVNSQSLTDDDISNNIDVDNIKQPDQQINISKKADQNKITINNENTKDNVQNLNIAHCESEQMSNIKICKHGNEINPINKTIGFNEKPKKSNDFFKELLLRQLPNINPTKKLTYNDIRRISKFLVTSIFDELNCSVWNGYITNEKNQTKGTYINFYFNQKKIALHRLLYLNFIGDILNTEYVKFSCVNKGKCCNVHHMKKYSYNSGLIPTNVEEPHVDNSVHIVQNKNDLVIEL